MIPTSIFNGIVLFVILWTGTLCLKDVKVIIPMAVEKGDQVIMKCLHDLEGDALYSVKWYKAEREFFRYTPKEVPATKQFPIPGLRVIEYESNSTQVVLDDVQLENSGSYCCEITADSPGFYTRMVYGDLQVVISPREDPKISKIKTKYGLGETLRGQCISRNSKPAANLTWYINGKPAKPMHIRHQKHKVNEYGLETAVSQIQQLITADLFAKGRLKIKCSAIIYDVYHRSFEMSIELDRPKPRHSFIMTTPSTLGFSSQNTYRLSPIDDANSSRKTKHSHESTLLLVILGLFPLLNLR